MKIYIHAAIVAKILSGRYKVVTSTVVSIRFTNKFSKADRKFERVVEFANDMNIVADYCVLHRLSVGDEAILVFVNGHKYPMIIDNAKSFCVQNSN